MGLRVGVVGIEHLHLFEMVDGLVAAGAETVCHAAEDGPLSDMYVGWRTESESRSVHAVIADDTLDLVVLAGVPSSRAGIAAQALHAGRHVLAAKPAVTTLDDLAIVEEAARSAGRRWWVFFSERLVNRAVIDAVRLVREGAIGDLVAVSGAAPHTLAPLGRPHWFFDRALSGGILCDLAAHQADQLLALAGLGSTEVVAAHVANVANPDHPELQDLGRVMLRHVTDEGRVVVSHHHVDWLSPDGLGTWGDVRLVLTGTAGTIEVRSNIDVAGEPGNEHLILVDGERARRVDCSGVELDWAERLTADVEHGTDTLMSHDHSVAACEVVLRAQAVAEVERLDPR